MNRSHFTLYSPDNSSLQSVVSNDSLVILYPSGKKLQTESQIIVFKRRVQSQTSTVHLIRKSENYLQIILEHSSVSSTIYHTSTSCTDGLSVRAVGIGV